MPELPEVEVLVRHLAPLLCGRTVESVEVRRIKVLVATSPAEFTAALLHSTFVEVSRRGKYLLFQLKRRGERQLLTLLGHLGMTGRMYLQPRGAALPKHAAVILGLAKDDFVFEDTRYFGRFTLDTAVLEQLGPEPLGEEFTPERFARALKHSAQPIKVRLLDQRLVAGVGNIYASEALFRAGISPRTPARRLTRARVDKLWHAVRETLEEAIRCGSTLQLNYSGSGKRDGLFYFGSGTESPGGYEERLRVYDRLGAPCCNCGRPIRRIVQCARSTFYCPRCQHS